MKSAPPVPPIFASRPRNFYYPVVLVASLLSAEYGSALAADGRWLIEQLPIRNVLHPVINNSEEIVWALNLDGGVYSSTRGKLANSGITPHLSNDGEVVCAEYFGGPGWDLMSTERGRLTFGALVDVNNGGFDVNISGEFVYNTKDASGYQQIYSSVRGQITFDEEHHRYPSINDLGEIVWLQDFAHIGGRSVSNTRGILPANFGPLLIDLNNAGEALFLGSLFSPQAGYTFPHVFSSSHGVVIDNPDQYQWGGGLNDSGVIVWETQGSVYKAQWVPEASGGRVLLGVAFLWIVTRTRLTRATRSGGRVT